MRSILFASIIWMASTAAAEANQNCADFIRVDELASSRSTSVQMALINSISREDYEQDQSNISTGLTIPIEGIVLGGEGDWSEFSEKRSALNALTSWSLDYSDSRSVVLSQVSNSSWDVVRACLRGQQSGLYLAPYEPIAGQVAIGVIFRAPTSSTPGISLDWTIVGSSSVPHLSRIARGNEEVVQFEWLPDQSEISVIVSGGGYRSNQVIFRRPPPEPLVRQGVTWTAWVRGPQDPQRHFHAEVHNLPDRVVCQNHSRLSVRQWNESTSQTEEHFGYTTYLFRRHGTDRDYHTYNVTINGEQLQNRRGQVLVSRANEISVFCR